MLYHNIAIDNNTIDYLQMKKCKMDVIGFKQHNHAACADEMIAVAEAYCSDNNLQFTPTRRRVLDYLLEDHKVLGAYDILQRLSHEGHAAQPPTAYRALEFLQKHGFVHKIERLNAFIACAHPLETHTPAFMICRECHSVAETASPPSKSMFGQAEHDTGFHIEQVVFEAHGLCPDCFADGAPA